MKLVRRGGRGRRGAKRALTNFLPGSPTRNATGCPSSPSSPPPWRIAHCRPFKTGQRRAGATGPGTFGAPSWPATKQLRGARPPAGRGRGNAGLPTRASLLAAVACSGGGQAVGQCLPAVCGVRGGGTTTASLQVSTGHSLHSRIRPQPQQCRKAMLRLIMQVRKNCAAQPTSGCCRHPSQLCPLPPAPDWP